MPSNKKRIALDGQSQQEVIAAKITRDKQQEHIEHCQHLLSVLEHRPPLWTKPEFKQIRESISFIHANPDKFPPIVGDCLPDVVDDRRDNAKSPVTLTKEFVSRIAGNQCVAHIDAPIFQVVSTRKKFEVSVSKIEKNSIHFTHLRILDGSGDVMVGRLNMNLAHDGSKLRAGEIVQLHLFTPLTYVTSNGGEGDERAPMVVIHTYSKIGYAPLPRIVGNPMTCVKMLEKQKDNELAINSTEEDEEYEKLVDVDCTSQQRYCAKYGLSPVICVCKTDPPDKINLEVVREYCWFATKEVRDMDNRNKRNMLYWWFMTNIYNVGGRGVTKKPPECLIAAIRKAYPEEDGKYTGYKPGKNSGKGGAKQHG